MKKAWKSFENNYEKNIKNLYIILYFLLGKKITFLCMLYKKIYYVKV